MYEKTTVVAINFVIQIRRFILRTLTKIISNEDFYMQIMAKTSSYNYSQIGKSDSDKHGYQSMTSDIDREIKPC